jgi:hypothetical protein
LHWTPQQYILGANVCVDDVPIVHCRNSRQQLMSEFENAAAAVPALHVS